MPAFYTGHDISISDECELELPDGGPVLFQFPPKILSDNRKGNWNEGDMRGDEPVAVFKNSGPREIGLTWTYIVDGGQWTTSTVASEIHRIRGYFANVLSEEDRMRSLVCKFKYGLFGGQDAFSARIKSIDVKHGDTIVMPDGNASLAFPLRSDISIDLRLWTSSKGKQSLDGLKNQLTPEWY